MTTIEILSLVVTLVGIISFALVITVLYNNYAQSQISEINSGRHDADIINDVIFENLEEIKKKNKIKSIVKNVSFCVSLVIILPIFVVSLISKFNGNVLMVGDNAVMVVASGSMSKVNPDNYFMSQHPELDNQFQTFDIINIRKVEQNELKIGDVIAFQNDDEINIIHRITSIVSKDGEIFYETQGDANPSRDSYRCTYEDVIGIYTGKRVAALGAFIIFFQSYSGIITIISVIYCLAMIDKITKKVDLATEKRIEFLSTIVDFRKLISENSKEDRDAKVEFVEKLYYKNVIYTFENDNTLVGKDIDEQSKVGGE